MKNNYNSVSFDDEKNELVIIDQTKLPGEEVYLHLATQPDIYTAIYLLQVRGAPAIGIAAAYGAYLAACEIKAANMADFLKQFKNACDYLNSARPTAVNLSWALSRMYKCAENSENPKAALEALKILADTIYKEDEEVCRKIGEYGLTLLKKGDGILMHCNPGALATARYGTATAPIYLGQERGYELRVYADETRPLLQGARLTAYELQAAGVDVTLICDNMSSLVMKQGWINCMMVGCDRVAANGDTANKIGTNGAAIIANYYDIPVYIAAPTSTIDMNTATGNDIIIEQRPAHEVTEMWYSKRMAPEDVKVYNPAFDVTDHSLISGIITEYGIAYPPYSESLIKIFEKKNAQVKG